MFGKDAPAELQGPPPVHLGVPMLDPGPAPGCDVCAALSEQREQARKRRDMSKVSDLNIEIRNHPHGAA
ncbi:hypothetical protein [Streptomyces noursei]|uniref:hypothetical protein n=1 Tax=Streptomyces noursei TaxID=1971 RepID=UPI00196605FF|nr:hypothetical protein [Streptomyces noursei]QRX97537.1 hypothetical protein JNO44_42740 [Streptomyces noursei]